MNTAFSTFFILVARILGTLPIFKFHHIHCKEYSVEFYKFTQHVDIASYLLIFHVLSIWFFNFHVGITLCLVWKNENKREERRAKKGKITEE